MSSTYLAPPERIQSTHRRASSQPPPPYSSMYNSHRQHQHQHHPDQASPSPRPEGGRRRHHHRSRTHRHNRQSTRVRPDIIDQLDSIGGISYHHEGPFDAASRERNISSKRSPIQALKTTNEEALKATPRDMILDSVRRHRPLDGVAYYPPGTTDRHGQTYDYEEGYNMMTEDRGNFKRWPGMKFRDEDFKNDPMYMHAVSNQKPKRKSWSFGHHKRAASTT